MSVTQTVTADNVLRLFPFVDTHDSVPQSATSEDPDLRGYDEVQANLMKEECIVLDENDRPIGSASKKDCTLCLCNIILDHS